MRRFTKLLGTVPRLLATLLMVATSVMFTGGSAGAVMGCGEFSYGFDAVTLSNDSINTVNGPFDIELPAGTYDVVFQTCTATDDVNQQWYVALDSGYVSPTTLDIADDDTYSVDVVEAQEIDRSASMTVHHVGGEGAGSIDPICVGFTPVARAALLPAVPTSLSAAEADQAPVSVEASGDTATLVFLAGKPDTIDFAVVEQAPTVAVLPSVQMTQPVGTAIETFGAPSRILLAVGALALIASGAFVVLGTRSAPFTG